MALRNDFSTLFELLPIGAYRTDAHSRTLRVNSAMVRIFGFESEDEMLAASQGRGHGWYAQPGRRAEFHAQLASQGAVLNFVSEMRRHGTGETFWINENAHLVRDAEGKELYYEGTVEDITSRVRAQEMLQVTLDSAGRAITRVAADGTVVLYNQRLLELLELPEKLMAARPHMRDVVRFQEERGDFGENREFLEEDTREAFALNKASTVSDALNISARYLRRTRKGLVIEVTTQALPDGGLVRTYSDVTPYVTAQQELANKTRSLQITLDSMSQGIATIDTAQRVVMTNRRYQELLDFPESLMATQPTLQQLLDLQIQRGDFGENFTLVDAPARRSVAHNIPPVHGPETYLRKTRDGRTLEVLTRPLPDGGVVRTFTDMTAYAQAQEALARKEAQLSALVSNMPDRVWLKDAEGRFVLYNRAYQRRFGLHEENVIGRTGHEVFGPEIGGHHRETDLMAMAMDRPLEYEDVIADPLAGTHRHVEIVKVAMRDNSGKCIGLLGIARDITARKEAEAALIAAKEAAEAGERAKAEFLANMSHEIRTPMNAVIGMSDLLLDSPLSPAQREYAEAIRTSGDTLLALINDILDFSKIESGNLALEQAPVDLADCVESALQLASGPAAAKGIDLMYWIDDGVPPLMLGDAARLRQIFVNLISNALKFTHQGEVVVTLSPRLSAEGAPLLHASVRDTGIGIPADRMDRLFQVFSQVDASTTRQFGGTGLGLAICRRLVALMGGRIWVESREGQGSVFQFEVPIHDVPELGPVASLPPHLDGQRILVVDDNATHRAILTRQLHLWGMQARSAATGQEALQWIDDGQEFDAAILDAQMPGMDGYAVATQLRLRDATARLPIIMLTSLGAAGQKPAIRRLLTLSKPVKVQALLDTLSAAIEQPSSPAPLFAAPANGSKPRLSQEYPLRLLVAEDNLANQRVAALLLGALGYDIEIVDNGQRALDAVAAARAGGQPFDVLVLDVQMPVMGGLEVSQRLREQYRPAERPWIVAMTANTMLGDREECLAAGMDDYLSKPIRAAALRDALRSAAQSLAKRRASAQT